MPAARFFYGLAVATALTIVGVLVPVVGWVALALDVLLLLLLAWDARRAAKIDLQAVRTWPELLMQGQEAEIRLELWAPGQGFLRIRLREVLHPGLDATPRRLETALQRGSRQDWIYQIVPRRRGEHLAGPLMARILAPWGLWWRQVELLPSVARRVYPQVHWEGKVGHLLLLAHRHALGRNPQPFQGFGTELYALREYLPGDPLNRIHWKASARHGRLISREDTWERGARVLILLDAARSMSGRDGQRSKLDHALAAALALARVAVGRGDSVTLVAFSDRIERTVRIHAGHGGSGSGSKAGSIQAAYAAFYDLDASLTEPAFDLAAERAISLEARRSTVVLFTSVVDLAAAELLRLAVLRLEQRHRPLLINLEDPELLDLAWGEPQNEAEAFGKVAALEIQLANRRLGQQLRHAGIRVVNAPADRLALAALENYLAMLTDRR